MLPPSASADNVTAPQSRRKSLRFLSRSTSISSLRRHIVNGEKKEGSHALLFEPEDNSPGCRVTSFKSLSELSPRSLENEKREASLK